jgi:low affinity Fe/Cu permease
MNEVFRKLSQSISAAVGTPTAFIGAISIIVIWGITGPIFHFSDTWQLVINTGTTIITFLMVFLIQNAQNRDSIATQLKLDELIRAVKSARNEMVDVEDLSDEQLAVLEKKFKDLAQKAEQTAEKIEETAQEVESELN